MWNQLLYLTCSCSDLLIEKRTIIVLLLIYVTLLLFFFLLFQVNTSQILVNKKEGGFMNYAVMKIMQLHVHYKRNTCKPY
jgi:hypothetical protein